MQSDSRAHGFLTEVVPREAKKLFQGQHRGVFHLLLPKMIVRPSHITDRQPLQSLPRVHVFGSGDVAHCGNLVQRIPADYRERFPEYPD